MTCKVGQPAGKDSKSYGLDDQLVSPGAWFRSCVFELGTLGSGLISSLGSTIRVQKIQESRQKRS